MKGGSSDLETEQAVGKLFFDTFSKRVLTVEESVKKVMAELDELKRSREKFQLSDLVLLERLQTAEGMLAESLEWIRRVANAVVPARTAVGPATQLGSFEVQPPVREYASPAVTRSITLPGGETGSLSSITTPTELQVLTLLSEQGAKSAPEIGRLIGRSREHSARLMKKLFQEGYVRRDQARIPFRYSLVDRIRAGFQKPEEKKAESQEAAAVQG